MYLEDMTVEQIKDYLRGLYAIPLEDINDLDRQQIKGVKALLLEKGVQVECEMRVKFIKGKRISRVVAR